VIVTEDKDLKTIPGELFFPSSDELVKVDEFDAELNFYSQALGGDVTDGIIGCPGIGPLGARQLLEEKLGVIPYQHTFKSGPRAGQSETRCEKVPMDSYWSAILSHYERAGLSEEDAILQARLAYILQYKNYDFKKGEIIHWVP
jgi:5'-3' exonuclease